MNYKVQVASYEVRVARYDLQGTSYEVQVPRYKLRGTCYEVQVTSRDGQNRRQFDRINNDFICRQYAICNML
jgi:hypothetical protein